MARASSYNYHNLSAATDTQTNFPIKQKFSSFITDSEIQSEFSHHDPGVARINNGSFGCCPASVISALQQWQLKWLHQPTISTSTSSTRGYSNQETQLKNLSMQGC
ncbi:hypothetical protein M0R45_027032 [Rubus argutus]